MDLSYVVTPLVAWLLAGCIKFAINSIGARRWAFDLIGYGGMPSNHSSIVSSAAAIIAFKEGLQHPALVVAVALAFIVFLDANSLRRKVGKHAEAINQLNQDSGAEKLRESVGHSGFEILAGVATGCVSAYMVHVVFSQWLV